MIINLTSENKFG